MTPYAPVLHPSAPRYAGERFGRGLCWGLTVSSALWFGMALLARWAFG